MEHNLALSAATKSRAAEEPVKPEEVEDKGQHEQYEQVRVRADDGTNRSGTQG